MAADTITWAGPQTVRVDMDATAGNIHQVIIPKQYKRAKLTFMRSNDTTADTGKWSYTGAEGAAIGSDAYPVGSGAEVEIYLGNHGLTLRLAGGTNSGKAHLALFP